MVGTRTSAQPWEGALQALGYGAGVCKRLRKVINQLPAAMTVDPAVLIKERVTLLEKILDPDHELRWQVSGEDPPDDRNRPPQLGREAGVLWVLVLQAQVPDFELVINNVIPGPDKKSVIVIWEASGTRKNAPAPSNVEGTSEIHFEDNYLIRQTVLTYPREHSLRYPFGLVDCPEIVHATGSTGSDPSFDSHFPTEPDSIQAHGSQFSPGGENAMDGVKRMRSLAAELGPEKFVVTATKVCREIQASASQDISVPEGAIRIRDARILYDLPSETIASWIRRSHVRVLARVTPKEIYISEEDLRKRVELRDANKAASGKPP